MDLYYCYRLAGWLSRTLPRAFIYRIATWLSKLFYTFDRTGRCAVEANIRQIHLARGEDASEAYIRRRAKETFACFGKYLVDFFRYAQLQPDDVGRIVDVDHPEYIRQAAADGRGAIAVSAHFGNWEMGGAVFPALGYRVHAVVLPQRFDKVNSLFQRQRQKRGFDVSFLGGSPAALMRALRRGEFVCLLGDIDFVGNSGFIDFFGKPARMPRGPAFLAYRLKVPVLVGFVRRREDDSLMLHLYPPIRPEEHASEEAIQMRIRDLLQDFIGRYPAQWFVFRNFWNGAAAAASAGNPAGASSVK